MPKTMKHSEGPWLHFTNWLCPGELKGCIIKSADFEIAHVLSRSVGSQAICDANARLMAAAPAMLAALKDAANRLRGAGMLSDNDEVLEAISDAEGRS